MNEKVEARHNIKMQSVAGNQIYDTKENAQCLKEREVFNARCDRSRAKRRGELEKEAYRGIQRITA